MATTWKDFEKIPGTRVTEEGGKWVRTVKSSGKVFAAKDIVGVKSHLAKIGETVPETKKKEKGEKRKKEDTKKEKKEKAAPPTAEGLDADMDAYWKPAPEPAAEDADDAEGGAKKKRKKGEKGEPEPEPTADGLDDDMDSYWATKGGEEAAAEEPAAEEPAAEEPAAEPATEEA